MSERWEIDTTIPKDTFHDAAVCVGGEVIGDIIRLHRAEEIVRAVNAHDELVAALEDAADWLHYLINRVGVGTVDAQGVHAEHRARALLARVRGESEGGEG